MAVKMKKSVNNELLKPKIVADFDSDDGQVEYST